MVVRFLSSIGLHNLVQISSISLQSLSVPARRSTDDVMRHVVSNRKFYLTKTKPSSDGRRMHNVVSYLVTEVVNTGGLPTA